MSCHNCISNKDCIDAFTESAIYCNNYDSGIPIIHGKAELELHDAKIREKLGYELKSDMEEIFKGTTQGRFDWCDAYRMVWKALRNRCGIDKEQDVTDTNVGKIKEQK